MSPSAMRRRVLACLPGLWLMARARSGVAADTEAAWDALRAGGIVVFRHASAPGFGDPPDMRIGDCGSQRNLDAAGREQAARIARRLRDERVEIGAVWSSQWCRCLDTARPIAAGMAVREVEAFNSFVDDRSAGPARTAAALRLLAEWRGPGTLVVVTHQVNISALTGMGAASGEGVVLRIEDGRALVLGRLSV